MGISIESIKELRKASSASLSECKAALEKAEGDLGKAVTFLRKRGLEIAARKEAGLVREGRIEAYVHTGNKLGVLLEVGCETDFVARNEIFCRFTKDIAMQVTASSPPYIKKEDVPAAVLKKIKEKDRELFFKEQCLLEQPFIKDPNIAVKDYLGSMISQMGENIVIRRFARYKLGE